MSGKQETEAERWAKLPWQIKMADEAWQQFWRYTEIVDGEVGCFGYATISEESKEVVVDTIFLFPQEADTGSVDINDDALAFAINKAIEDDRLNDLRFCIHSHGNMSAFWSGTDDDMIKKMGKTANWFASAVFNKKRDAVGRIDTFTNTPFGRCQWTVGNKLDVVSDASIQEDTATMAELAQYVKKPAPKTTSTVTYGSGHGGKRSNGHSYACVCGDCKRIQADVAAAASARHKAEAEARQHQQQLPPAASTHEGGTIDEQAWGQQNQAFFEWSELTDDVITYEQAEKIQLLWTLSKVVARDGHVYFYGDASATFLAFERDENQQLVFQPGISRVSISAWQLAVDPDGIEEENVPTITAKEVTS